MNKHQQILGPLFQQPARLGAVQPRLPMCRACARTIGLRIRASRHGDASARCSGSNRWDQLNASCPLVPPSKTLSTSSAIHIRARFVSSETKRPDVASRHRGLRPAGLPNIAPPESIWCDSTATRVTDRHSQARRSPSGRIWERPLAVAIWVLTCSCGGPTFLRRR